MADNNKTRRRHAKEGGLRIEFTLGADSAAAIVNQAMQLGITPHAYVKRLITGVANQVKPC